jgi:FtsP/CotA-like multicopper oxidase with cupredoxin domain
MTTWAITVGLLVAAGPAAAQVPFPPQNPNGPTGAARQTNYPYPGQCVTNTANAQTLSAFGWGVPACDAATNAASFLCEPGASGFPNQSAGGWRTCGAVVPFKTLNPILAASVPVVTVPATPATPKFVWELLNPPDYTPDTAKFPGADYYEIAVHEAWGFQNVASALPGAVGVGLFPDPLKLPGNALGTIYPPVPNGMQWTGLICNVAAGCTCPAEITAAFAAAYCSAGGLIPPGAPLYTPVWGVGQKNAPGLAALTGLAAPATRPEWSPNNFVATWPSISIRATKNRPVVVRWVNEFPNNHLFCPHPEAADWPCAIDRTFMGVKAKIDPATTPAGFASTTLTSPFSPDGVNRFGSPQQPDNSWVTHLHGGEVPPSVDGFAEKWFGNARTGMYYSATSTFVSPAFDGPIGALKRPGGAPTASSVSSWANDTYVYPMTNEESTIWFHDHTLGKTHHNVVAGPAGFFPVFDPAKHSPVVGGVCSVKTAAGTPDPVACSYTWLDPVTSPRNALGIPKYDLFMALQDRAFNDDGTINFANGLGNPVPAVAPPGASVFTNGLNPQVHPTWVPEYFGDHVVVNGVLWPKVTTEPGWYRIRIADGSDSRCWTLGFSTTQPAVGARPNNNVTFTVLANDQGYLAIPKQAVRSLTMCPGERYELLVNFGALPGRAGLAKTVYMTNSAAAPFPVGIAPNTVGSPYAEMNVVMKFNVLAPSAAAPGVPTCGAAGLTYPTVPATTGCIALPTAVNPDPSFVDYKKLTMCGAAAPTTPCISAVRQLFLNEHIDGTTLMPLGMQINGVPFEYKVTETPRKGTVEVWKIINLTVDAHPMHPHLVKHQIVESQTFNVGAYKRALCGSTTCQPGTSPGMEMQVVPDVTATAAGAPLTNLYLTGVPVPTLATDLDSGWKDASMAMPGQVTTIIAKWDAGFAQGAPTVPGSAGGITDLATCTGVGAAAAGCSAPFTYESITSGPYVWHCHINSHEDSEMMRTSLVVP